MTKTILKAAMVLFPLIAQAGGTVGNGGNDVAYDFHGAASRAIAEVSNFNELKALDPAKLQIALADASIFVTATPITIGAGETKQDVVAMNIPAEKKIIINESKWRAITSDLKKEALSLHEILGLTGQEKTGDYHYSQMYFELKTSKVDPKFKDFLKPQILNEAKDAKVKIIEFADFECPYCVRNRATLEKVIANYGDQVEVIFKNKPLSVVHANAKQAALAGICANVQGQFKPMHDQLFDNSQALSSAKINEIAKSISALNMQEFDSCMTSQQAQLRLEIDESQFDEAFFMGTPANLFHAADKTVRFAGAFPYEEYEAAIKEMLKK